MVTSDSLILLYSCARTTYHALLHLNNVIANVKHRDALFTYSNERICHAMEARARVDSEQPAEKKCIDMEARQLKTQPIELNDNFHSVNL